MAESMKESGMIIISMEKATKSLIMVLFMKDLMLRENLKDMDDILGIMDNHTKVSGRTE